MSGVASVAAPSPAVVAAASALVGRANVEGIPVPWIEWLNPPLILQGFVHRQNANPKASRVSTFGKETASPLGAA